MPQLASAAQGRTAGKTNKQVIFPISAILGCKLRQFMDVSRQLFLPATLRCQISTGMFASRPMAMASSSAPRTPSASPRMWLA